MRSASVIGRVGTLAVAVGVGVVAAGGVASAADGSDGSTGSPSSSSSSSAGSTSSPAGATADQDKAADTKAADAKAADTKAADAKDADTKAAETADGKDADADSDSPAADDPADEVTKSTDPTPKAEVAETPEPTATQTPVETADPTSTESATPSQTPEETKSPATSAPTTAPTSAPTTAPTSAPTTAEKAVGQATTQESEQSTPTASARSASVAVDESSAKTAEAAAEPAGSIESADETATETEGTTAAATTVVTVTQPKSLLENVVGAVVTVAAKVVTGVLTVLGIVPSANAAATSDGMAAAVMAFLGWGARREADEEETTTTTVVSQDASNSLGIMTLTATSPTTIQIAWVTGASSINDTLARFGIYGTDLGIMWDNGITGDNPSTAIVEQRQILMAFGDTFTNALMTTGWRSNVILRSADNVLSNGISVPNGIVDQGNQSTGAYSGSAMSTTLANYARELIGKYPYSNSTQVTIIPTGAISVAGAGVNGATRQYIAFMSIKQWGAPGSWTTNYSAISYSDDNGQNWTVVPKTSVRSGGLFNSPVWYQGGADRFQMVSFVKPPEGSADAAAGYIYATGTPAGRSGTVYLARVKAADILDVTKYDYWTGWAGWWRNAAWAASPILPKTKTSFLFFTFTSDTTAGELSMQYNTYLKKYVMLYTDSGNNVVMRTADAMNGTWSAGNTLATSLQYPGLYAPMVHPWSGTNLLKKADGSDEDPQYLYWNMSLWGNYNVTLMRTDLSALGL